MATICSSFLFHAVLFSLRATELLWHVIGLCTKTAVRQLQTVWRDGKVWRERLSFLGEMSRILWQGKRLVLHITLSMWWGTGTRRHDVSVGLFSWCAVPVAWDSDWGWCWAVGRVLWGWNRARVQGQPWRGVGAAGRPALHISVLNMPFSSYYLSFGRRSLSLDPHPQESDIQFLPRCWKTWSQTWLCWST